MTETIKECKINIYKKELERVPNRKSCGCFNCDTNIKCFYQYNQINNNLAFNMKVNTP